MSKENVCIQVAISNEKFEYYHKSYKKKFYLKFSFLLVI